jgi:hypothetical protein
MPLSHCSLHPECPPLVNFVYLQHWPPASVSTGRPGSPPIPPTSFILLQSTVSPEATFLSHSAMLMCLPPPQRKPSACPLP